MKNNPRIHQKNKPLLLIVTSMTIAGIVLGCFCAARDALAFLLPPAPSTKENASWPPCRLALRRMGEVVFAGDLGRHHAIDAQP